MGVLALTGAMASLAVPQAASAQRVARNFYQRTGAVQATPYTGAVRPRVEQVPPGAMRPQPMPSGDYADPFADETYHPDGYLSPEGCDSGCCPDGYGGYSNYNCGSTAARGGSCDMSCGASAPSGVFFTADYLYVRASFSEAVAFMTTELIQEPGQNITELDVHQFDFEYDSSYRFGGGVELGECCNQYVRFLYTRLTSDAFTDIPPDALIPFEVVVPPGGSAFAEADVDIDSYDLDCAKRILLGGEVCCQCGDACCDPCGGGGCADACCAPRCPAWDLTWAGGIRVANAEWSRSYTALDANGDLSTNHTSRMDFDGIGPKISLEGRRYFFDNGSVSLYLKGDISLLGGIFELEDVRTDEGGTAPDTITEQSLECRHIIPVTELEAGVSGQVTCNSRVSAGYLLSAWHDLGFRTEFDVLNPNFPIHYDDANILGFDGFFARFEWGY
jgi:hypothetical protein